MVWGQMQGYNELKYKGKKKSWIMLYNTKKSLHIRHSEQLTKTQKKYIWHKNINLYFSLLVFFFYPVKSVIAVTLNYQSPADWLTVFQLYSGGERWLIDSISAIFRRRTSSTIYQNYIESMEGWHNNFWLPLQKYGYFGRDSHLL